MGIDKFFNSLKKEYNIVKDIYPNNSIDVNTKYLFLDFNSIIHSVSQRVVLLLNKMLENLLLQKNGCGNDDFDELLGLLDSSLDLEKPDLDLPEHSVIRNFNELFNNTIKDQIIINNVVSYVQYMLKVNQEIYLLLH